MIVLALNPLISPDPGLFIWSTIAFGLLFILLSKYAWKPITKALHQREKSIEDALEKAEIAKKEVRELTKTNEALLTQARLERDEILKEAQTLKDKIISEAQTTARLEGAKLLDQARQEINTQKDAAIEDLKSQVASLSIEIATKILRKQLEDQQKQHDLVSDLLERVDLN